MIRSLLALVALCIAAPSVAAQALPNDSGLPLLPEQAAIDVTYIDLEVAVDIDSRTIEGVVITEARVVQPTAAVVFDLDSPFTVASVEEVGYLVGTDDEVALPLAFMREGNRLRVNLGRTAQPGQGLRLRVTYGGAPRVAPRPPWDGGFTWAETADGRPWVAVSCQIQGADLWWPVKDHPSDETDSLRIALRAPSDLRAISNGVWEGREDHGDGTATERWFVSTPINNYGVSFGIAPYEVVEAEYESSYGWTQTVPFYVLPERVEDAERQMPGFLRDLDFLERTFGPYAWRGDGYKILHTPYLGMEHQTLVAYGSDFQDNAFGFDFLHYHELAHEWWANLGTAPDWRDFWVHESFANYSESLYAEDIASRRDGPEAGRAAYLAYLKNTRRGHRNEIAIAPRETRTTQQMYALPDGRSNGDIYSKGGWILHTMRGLIDNDERFFAALRSILYPTVQDEQTTDGRQARFVSTEDVVRELSRAAGRDLSDVLEVYLRQPLVPSLAVERSGTTATVRWVLPDGLEDVTFDVPVEVEVGGQRTRLPMTGGVGTVSAASGLEVVLDPDGLVLYEPVE